MATSRRPSRQARGRRKKGAKTARRRPETETRIKTVLEHIGPQFIEDGARRMTPDDIAQLGAHWDELLERFRDSDVLARFKRDGEVAIHLLRDYGAGRYSQLPLWSASVIAFVLQYVAKPVDIIPDTVPVIGQLDDALVVSHGLGMVRNDLRAYRVWCRANDLAQ